MEEMKEEELRKGLEGGRLGAEEQAKGTSTRLLNLWPATSGLRNRLQARLYSTLGYVKEGHLLWVPARPSGWSPNLRRPHGESELCPCHRMS